jgi:hypothetical protein
MEDKSCGGCCCIEVPEDSKEYLSDIFRFRREASKSHLNGKGDIEGYEAQISKKEDLLSIYTLNQILEKKCHYLGFLNDEETKIGCLAHPQMNNGQDLRDFGFYKSAEECGPFFCASSEIYAQLTPEERKMFKKMIRDWDWYDLSNQEKMYDEISEFRESLQESRQISI